MSKGRSIPLAVALVTSGLSLSGCATEDYVDKHIAVVNQRIDELSVQVKQVSDAAGAAQQTASAAGASAQQANQRIDQLTSRVDGIEQQLAAKKPRG